MNSWDLYELCIWNPCWRPQGPLLSRDWEQLELKLPIVSFTIRSYIWSRRVDRAHPRISYQDVAQLLQFVPSSGCSYSTTRLPELKYHFNHNKHLIFKAEQCFGFTLIHSQLQSLYLRNIKQTNFESISAGLSWTLQARSLLEVFCRVLEVTWVLLLGCGPPNGPYTCCPVASHFHLLPFTQQLWNWFTILTIF